MAVRGFTAINEVEVPDDSRVVEHPAARDNSQALSMLLLALKALSQRFVIALSQLFTLGALASAFWLWMTILPNPTVNQLVGGSIYSMFILALEYVRRR